MLSTNIFPKPLPVISTRKLPIGFLDSPLYVNLLSRITMPVKLTHHVITLSLWSVNLLDKDEINHRLIWAVLLFRRPYLSKTNQRSGRQLSAPLSLRNPSDFDLFCSDGYSHGMRNEVERLSRGRGRAPLDKPAKQRLLYLLLIDLKEYNVLDEIPERYSGMTIRAVVFDIGGVLEITSQTGWVEKWEARLHLKPGELHERLIDVWREGSFGTISEEEVDKRIGQIMGMDQGQVEALMADLWEEYLGELNAELADYFSSLRPRYQTALLSNSFVGARSREQERYHFDEICDLLIYSHEEGMAKPERRIFELTCERLGVQPAEIVFLDNVEANVAAARECGLQAILFRETKEAIAAIQACLQAS